MLTPRGTPTVRFSTPDHLAEDEFERRLLGAPATGTVKGMYFEAVVQRAYQRSDARIGRPSYGSFSSYPLPEWLTVLEACAKAAYPNQPLPEALRLMGHGTFPTFQASTIGSVLLSVASDDVRSSLRLVNQMYGLSWTPGSATLARDNKQQAIIELRSVWDWPAAYHVGVFEGLLDAHDIRGELRAHVRSLTDVDLELRW